MRILVTGANGYLGRAVVDRLVSVGHEPVAMVRTERTALSVEIRVSDLLDESSLQRALHEIDAVVHLAGLTRARESTGDPLIYFRVNTGGTIALLSAMENAGVARLIFASTGAVYGTPDHQPMTEELPDAPPHPYAASKLAAELAIESQARTGRLSATILRLMNVAGGFDPDPTRLVPRALAAAAEHSRLEVNGDGKAVRDYLHIQDAAAAFGACLDKAPPPGEAERYIIGSGHGTSVLDVVSAVENYTGRRIDLVHRPPAPEPAVLVGDPSKAVSELSWSPHRSDIQTIVRDAAGHRDAARGVIFGSSGP
ncbi:NAD-dependent epimerase/dehydratase family protein [Nocardia carnea]|uniref:NAD-dependent epimerase/dehydratase family protein n=1 Tax=Nocardia carnea TaxID=37328 RepID=UPI0024564098|nr:NAD-dependent epimerase/dehydratase family protein [Nocardia carnea]